MENQEILNLAAFNKLVLNEAEARQTEEYLNFALAALNKMGEVACADVTPLIHSVELTNVFREDVAAKTVSREQILANAPQQSEGCFQVPKVVD